MKIIKHAAKLKAFARAGYIAEPAEHFRPLGKKWGAGYAYVDERTHEFRHRGVSYRIKYFSGCFFPFVVTD